MVLLNAAGAVPDTEIGLETRSKRQISNTQCWTLTPRELDLIPGVKAKYPNAVEIAAACPVYNCHGLVFGSRRTTVEYKEIQQILDDDGYELIVEKEAREGDIVLYFEDGAVSHSGFVIGKRDVISGTGISIPLVWSKWGRGPEMIHLVNHVEFYKGEGSVQYYRLVAWEDGWRDHGKN